MLATIALTVAIVSSTANAPQESIQSDGWNPPQDQTLTSAPPPASPAAGSDQKDPQTGSPAAGSDQKDPQAEQKEPPTPPHTGIRALFSNLAEDVKHLPAKQNAYLAAIGGGLAAVAHPADQNLNARLISHYTGVNRAFGAGKYFGNTPEQVGLSLGTYAFGRITHSPKVSHLGMDLLQAQILTEMLVEPLKYATNRERPDGSNHRSFPSGHAAVTFAGATVLERHLGWRKSLLGYTIASYVAASRLHDNRHYLSDVVFGAAVGSIAGRTVVHHASDYWSFAPVSVPGGGVALLVSRKNP
jgi:hypothetical protein